MSQNETALEPSEAPEQESTSGKKPPKWFHFRGRVLLIVPLALLVIGIVFGPRQYAQRRAIVAMREAKATVQTEPLLLPGVKSIFGEDYALELTSVYLNHQDFTGDQFAALSGVSTLQRLDLKNSGLDSATLARLKSAPSLYILHLADTQVDDAGLPALRNFPNLGVLSLDRTNITDEGIATLMELPALERLSLTETKISDQSLKHLRKMEQLTDLSLVGTTISDEGLQHLYGLPRLKKLELFDTPITREALIEFNRNMPHCQVVIPTE